MAQRTQSSHSWQTINEWQWWNIRRHAGFPSLPLLFDATDDRETRAGNISQSMNNYDVL